MTVSKSTFPRPWSPPVERFAYFKHDTMSLCLRGRAIETLLQLRPSLLFALDGRLQNRWRQLRNFFRLVMKYHPWFGILSPASSNLTLTREQVKIQ